MQDCRPEFYEAVARIGGLRIVGRSEPPTDNGRHGRTVVDRQRTEHNGTSYVVSATNGCAFGLGA